METWGKPAKWGGGDKKQLNILRLNIQKKKKERIDDTTTKKSPAMGQC